MFGLLALLTAFSAPLPAATAQPNYPNVPCEGVSSGFEILNPPEIKSVHGVLSLQLHLVGGAIANKDAVCWVYRLPTAHGSVLETTPPTLILKPGDRLVLTLYNHLAPPGVPLQNGNPIDVTSSTGRIALMAHGESTWGGQSHVYPLPCGQPQTQVVPTPDPYTGQIFGAFRPPWNETNMHFHGLPVSPDEPGDDVVHVLLCPTLNAAQPNWFRYDFVIPADTAPGTYWYHPHPHGESDNQLLEQLTGVILIETPTKSIPDNYYNRVIVVRDVGRAGQARSNDQAYRKAVLAARMRQPSIAQIRQQIARYGAPKPDFYHRKGGYPYADPQQCPSSEVQPPTYNTKELIVNQVPLPANPYGVQGLPRSTIKAGETQYVRFANTSADTILDIVELVNGVQVPMQVTDRDGVPIVVNKQGQPTWQPVSMNDVLLAPAARTEFYLTGTNPGDQIVIETLTLFPNVLGCLGDNTYQRNMMVFYVTGRASGTQPRPPAPLAQVPRRLYKDLWDAYPVHQRTWAFTEYVRPEGPLQDFYLTQLSDPTAVEHPFSVIGPPDVVVEQGTTEDWTFLDYTQEAHEMHMHQIHFLVLQSPGVDIGQGQLLDTVQVGFGRFKKAGDTTGDQFVPGAVKLRMDFSDTDIAGEFVFHCHILAHEDNGMMAKIMVLPQGAFFPNHRLRPILATGQRVPSTQLVDQTGKRFSLASLRGKTTVVTFGYTRCGGTHGCALTAAKFGKLQEMMRRQPVQLVELTVDPQRDDPATLRRYGAKFGTDPSRWELATGNVKQVVGLERELGETVPYHAPGRNEFYHDDGVVIVDRDGRIATRIGGDDWTPSDLAGRTLAVVNASEGSLLAMEAPKRVASHTARDAGGAAGALLLTFGVLAAFGRRRSLRG